LTIAFDMISLPAQSFSTHTVGLALGPRPACIRPGAQPIFFIFDAGMIHASDRIFPFLAGRAQIARLMGMAVPTDRPVIFVSTPLEYQVADDWKEKRKAEKRAKGEESLPETPNFRNWINAAEGKGFVKKYPNLRCDTFAHQYLILNQVSEQNRSGLLGG
jgi:hypothetical protein